MELKEEFPNIDSPWYTNDGATVGTSETITLFFKHLCKIGPNYGYFPKKSKS